MMAARCPRDNGPVLVGFGDLDRVVNLEPGLIVLHWRCACGGDHWGATGSVGSVDPGRGHAAVEAVRRKAECEKAGERLHGTAEETTL